MTKKDEKIIKFLQVLVGNIPKSKWKNGKIFIMSTNKEYDTLKEYFEKQMKEIFDLDVEVGENEEN